MRVPRSSGTALSRTCANSLKIVPRSRFAPQEIAKIDAVFGLRVRVGATRHLRRGQPSVTPCDLLETRDLETLLALDGRHELRRLEQTLVRARIEPRVSAAEQLDVQLPKAQVCFVHAGDLELATRRRLDRARNLDH